MSDLLKVARAARGDDWFKERVQAACILADLPFGGERILYHVAQAVVADIQVDADQTVDTSHVRDEDITAAVTAYTPATTTETTEVQE
jgi:hypothetical protein